MKYHVLLLIFAIAYQGVTGFPRGNQVYQYVSNHLKEQHRKGISYPIAIESIDKKTEPSFIPSLFSSPLIVPQITIPFIQELGKIEDENNNTLEQQRAFREKLFFIQTAVETIETVVGILEQVYEGAKQILNNIKAGKHPWAPENNASGNKTEANTSQATPSFDESLINQQTTPAKIDDNEKKPEDTENSWTTESIASSTETQENASQTVSTLDESTVNQQSTPDKNDDNEKQSEGTKNSLTPESTTSSNETQENTPQRVSIKIESTVNQQSTLVENDDNEKESENIEASLI